MKLVDARSGIEVSVGTKVAYGHGEWLKIVDVDEETLKATVEVGYYVADDDDRTAAERPSAIDVAERFADRSGSDEPELPPIKVSTVVVDLVIQEGFPGFEDESVLLLPS